MDCSHWGGEPGEGSNKIVLNVVGCSSILEGKAQRITDLAVGLGMGLAHFRGQKNTFMELGLGRQLHLTANGILWWLLCLSGNGKSHMLMGSIWTGKSYNPMGNILQLLTLCLLLEVEWVPVFQRLQINGGHWKGASP